MEQNNKRRAEDAERLPAEKLEWEAPEAHVAIVGLEGCIRNLSHLPVGTKLYTQPAAPAVDAAKLDDLGKLKALAEAATQGEWLVEDRTVYVLEHHGWSKGVELLRNRFSCMMSYDGSGIEHSELAANATYIAAANPAAILRIAARVAQLEGENDRLRGALGDEVAAATMLTDISIANGGFNATYEGGAAQMLAEQFADQFRKSGATNYLEIGVASKSDGLRLLVTLQRCDGKTPATLKTEAEAIVAQQAARIAELEARFSGAVLMAYVATDLDGHYDVGTTIEQAKQRAGDGCDTIFPLHDISPAFIELEGKPVHEGK